ncbi:MAG: hypothetical protein IJ297_08335 [Clostridia bacterium]|nr:hypothetical protein [Clostridia bacterium]
MRKIFSLILSAIIMLSSIPALAEGFTQEAGFSFDIYDSFVNDMSDEMPLMEIDEDVKTAFEERLIAAWENMDTEVQLYPNIKIHKDDITSYFASVYFENPKYYYVIRSFSGTMNSAGYLGKLTKLSYSVDSMDEVADVWAKIDIATEEILLYISPDMTDFEKIMTVHDYMVNNYVYNIADTDQTFLIMLDKVGVCAAYSEAFQHMMNVLGIEATLVTSDEMGHIWNMVKLDGRWYHVDITWDDPVPDQAARVNHQFMLLSTNAITDLGHYGFTAPYSAVSTVYNKADWRDDEGAIVTVDGVMYRVEENNLVDENDNVIYKNLDGGDGKWSVSETSYVNDVVWTGICEINGLLYFNTDTGIYSYNPETKETKCILNQYGIGGLYADKNVIVYSGYDFDEGNFVKKGEIKISDIRLGEPYYEGGKAVVRLYNDCDVPIWIISKGDGYKIHKVDAKSIGTAKFENGSEQTIYIWKNSLEPVIEKFTVSE